MCKSTDSIIHKLKPHSMIRTKQIERHISGGVHRIRIVFETCHLKSVCHSHIQFGLRTYCGRVKGWLHRPVMTEGNIILCTHSRHVQYDE